jgi:hypothetical protein
MSVRDVSLRGAEQKAQRISRAAQGWIVPLARFGYAAKGVVYVIVGALAVLAAFNEGGRTTNSRGALEEIVYRPYGRFLLGVVAIGLAGYAVWRWVQSATDTENKGSGAKGLAVRIGYAAVGLIYASLAYSAVRMILGSEAGGGGKREASQEWTARLLAQPFGRWLVGAAGLGVIAFAVYQLYKAYAAKFREKLKLDEMNEQTETLATRVGQIGLAARGVVFGIIGVFLLQAALHFNANEARGLSGALRALEQQPFGAWVLGAVALGLVAYGIFMFILARYRRIIL